MSWLACFLLLSAPAQAAAPPSSVPFEIIASKHMAVKIKVNGKGPYRVIFDTGAPITLLSSKIAKDAELKKGKQSMPSFFGMQGFFKVRDFELGELKAQDVSVVVMDHPTVMAISEVVGPIEGIVGFPFFAKFHTTIDYQAKTLTMSPTTFEPGDVMQNLMGSMMSGGKAKKITFSPATLWGLTVGKEASDEEDGVEVVHVFGASIAEKAGIKIGDRLLTVDGIWTDTQEDCYRAVSQIKTGRTVKVKVRRQGEEKLIPITPPSGV